MSTLLETVRVLHLEPTDVCQAACPLCARETDTSFNKDVQHVLTVNDIERIVGEQVIYRLDKMFMCGNYGDPAASHETLSIFEYFRTVNSSITLGMNTNGGLQNSAWWARLAGILYKPADYVVFSVDGLEDTNHLYRRNVSWDRVMQNAKAFIQAGGNAHWDMLVYKHNEHQVDACEQLAAQMGFKWFRAKVSKRPATVEWLQSPKGWARPTVDSGEVNCFRNNDQSLYVSAKGLIHPCCWLGHGIETINNFDQIQAGWSTDTCNPVCKENCSTSNNLSNFTGQWQRNVPLVGNTKYYKEFKGV
jgi:MoaA/NifB/PqqE/SkfB family radical SAM enzyme